MPCGLRSVRPRWFLRILALIDLVRPDEPLICNTVHMGHVLESLYNYQASYRTSLYFCCGVER